MSLFTRINRRYRINRAVRELAALNDEVLRDIGIERGNIASMVEHMIDQDSIQTRSLKTGTKDSAHNDFHLTGGATA